MARCRVLCVCCLCCALIGVAASAVPAAAETAAVWHKPVDGDLVRAFDPPQSHYGAGHLGVDFRTPPGTPVRAAGPGEVTFAGSIAGAVHVVVAHAGGLRTSYSYLTAASVRRGDAVRAGDVLGTSGGTGVNHDGQVLHFGLRSGDEYLDPMLLFGAVDLAARRAPRPDRGAVRVLGRPGTTGTARRAPRLRRGRRGCRRGRRRRGGRSRSRRRRDHGRTHPGGRSRASR